MADPLRKSSSGGTRCAHCGQLVLGTSRTDEPIFCCAGCEAVWHFLRDEQLEDYYRVRDAPSPLRSRGTPDEDLAGLLCALSGQTVVEMPFDVPEIHCAACVWLLEKIALRHRGVESIDVQLDARRVRLRWRPADTDLPALANAFASAGYSLRLPRDDTQSEQEAARDLWLRTGVAGALAGNIMLVTVPLYAGQFSGISDHFAKLFLWVAGALTLPVVFWCAAPFHRRALGALRRGVPHIDLPVSLGILIAFAGSIAALVRGQQHVYFDSIAALVFLLLAGRVILERGHRRARTTSRQVTWQTATEALRVAPESGAIDRVPVSELQAGDLLYADTGQLLVADGKLESEEGRFNMAVLTGESRPAELKRGDQVYAGTTNLGAPIRYRVTATGEQTRINGIAQLAHEAGRGRAPIMALADRIATALVAVTLIAVVGTLLWWWPHSIDHAIAASVAVAVVMCPCALGLATPLALAIGQSLLHRRSLMLKHGAALQRLAAIDTIVFDKTGTLTTGTPQIVHWQGLATIDGLSLKEAVASIEQHSLHPIARAFATIPGGRYIAEDVHEEAGLGIQGRVAGHTLRIGGSRWIGTDIPDAFRAPEAPDITSIWVECDGRVVARIDLRDELRPDAKDAVRRLVARGIEPVIVSGDRQTTVDRVAAAVGIETAFGNVTPEQKLALVKRLGERVGMVGDGANDAAALAGAHTGIAMAGSVDQALEAADGYLLDPGLSVLAEAIETAKATMAAVRRNIALSIVYNIIGLSLAATGSIGPLAAALLMPLSSVTVTTSSLLLFRRRNP
ncbi:MAG: heavy metal translocating P-type ATPase [Candidatus Dadabacteria bacterium]|nr:MAG: heavy metal translocating P-type ATPase [Candidatus Dadabacteria bacterium]